MSHADSDDYDEVVDDVLSFNISDTEQCHNISVRNDRSCEYEMENFISHLTTDDYNIAISIAMMKVYIEDQSEMECSELLPVKNILTLVNYRCFLKLKVGVHLTKHNLGVTATVYLFRFRPSHFALLKHNFGRRPCITMHSIMCRWFIRTWLWKKEYECISFPSYIFIFP